MFRILAICVFFGCIANCVPAQQAPPRTELLMRLSAELAAPQEIGVTPVGNRRIYYVTRGEFAGPRLKGEVLPGGGDWVLTDKDGVSRLDVRITLRCDDGSLIFVSYRGIVDISPEIRARIAKGEDVSPDLYYFRISPMFETGSKKFAWLNRTVAIGLGKKTATGVAYDIFAVK
ncbi:MAG: DUF3237 domain-containing protein [Acidobacteriaceae bacterium]